MGRATVAVRTMQRSRSAVHCTFHQPHSALTCNSASSSHGMKGLIVNGPKSGTRAGCERSSGDGTSARPSTTLLSIDTSTAARVVQTPGRWVVEGTCTDITPSTFRHFSDMVTLSLTENTIWSVALAFHTGHAALVVTSTRSESSEVGSYSNGVRAANDSWRQDVQRMKNYSFFPICTAAAVHCTVLH
jgi:hypothetical protein